MLQFHIAVCDDEPFAAASISNAAERTLSALGAQAQIEVFNDGASLAHRVEEAGFDLVLLDIEMPGLDGIQLATALREFAPKTEIVFVSNNESRVFESLPLRPLSFVRKSRFNDDMPAAMEAFVHAWKTSRSNRVITLKMAHAMGTFPVDEIRYIEARGRDKILNMTNGRTEVVLVTLDELGRRLEPLGFYRVHKGFLVNFAHVRQLSGKGLTVGTELIPISRGKTDEVKRAYMDFLAKKNAVMLG